MHMHPAAGLAGGDLRRKGDGDAVFVGQRTEDPFGDQQLVGGIFELDREEFNLILFKGQVRLR